MFQEEGVQTGGFDGGIQFRGKVAAVEVGAESQAVRRAQVKEMFDMAQQVFWSGVLAIVSEEGAAIVETDEAVPGGHFPDVGIGEVPGVSANGAGVGVGSDEGFGGDGEHIVQALIVEVGHVG